MSSRLRKATACSRATAATANRVLRKIRKEIHKEAHKEILRVRSKTEMPRQGREASHDAGSSAHGCYILGTGLRHRGRALDSCGPGGAGDDFFGLSVQFGSGAGR